MPYTADKPAIAESSEHAYARFSEGRAAHWLVLIAADRVDSIESHLASFRTLRPDNPITQTGVMSEFSRRGIASRFGQKRGDLAHQPLDPIIVAGPWIVSALIVFAAAKALLKTIRVS